MERFACVFDDGFVAGNKVEIVYWINSAGQTTGEAYFCRDDYCANVQNGEFSHPYSGLHYKLHVPSRFGKSKDAILDVLKWQNAGRYVPVTCK